MAIRSTLYQKTVKRVCSVLENARIPYMLVGGVAVLFYGAPRLTMDIDIVVMTKNFGRIGTWLNKAKLKFHKEEVTLLARISNRFVATDPSGELRIDFWLAKLSYERKALQRRVKQLVFPKTRLYLISPEDLILFKLLASRSKDIDDVYGIAERQKNKLDRKYLERWAAILGLKKQLDHFRM